jgi:hypothetical protein
MKPCHGETVQLILVDYQLERKKSFLALTPEIPIMRICKNEKDLFFFSKKFQKNILVHFAII